MKRKKTFMIMLGLLLVLQPLLMTNLSNAYQFADSTPLEITNSVSNIVKKDIGAGGEEQLIANVIHNSGFEDTYSNGGPEGFNYGSSAFQYVNTIASEKYAGTYSCDIQSYGTSQFSANAYLSRQISDNNTPYVVEDIDLDFWAYIVQNPDISNGGNIFFYLQFYHQPSSTSYYIYYYLSTSSIPVDSGNNVFINASIPSLSWENVHRDVTLDFETAFGPANPQTYLNYIYVYASSPSDPTGLTEILVDDFSAENSTGYNFITTNEGFETGTTDWYYNNRGISSVLQTTDHTEGTYAINMTAYTPLPTLDAYTYLESYFGDWNPDMGYYTHNPGELTIDFDWKYSEPNGAFDNQYARFYIYGHNETYDFELHWMLGDVTDAHRYSNYSSSGGRDTYYLADGFGERDVWHSFSVDIFEFTSAFNINNMAFMYCGIRIYTGNDIGSTTQLLVDNFQLKTYPTGDPSFEEDWNAIPSDPIPSWYGSSSDEYINYTPDAHSGDNAANLTAHSGTGNVNIFRYLNLAVTQNLYTDFWYKLDSIESGLNTYAYINIELYDGGEIYYVLGSSSNFGASNSTYDVYFWVDNFNQTGEWLNLVRNIYDDIEAAFGPGDWEIYDIRFQVYAQGGLVTSMLVDDVYFVLDSTGPQLVSQLPLNTPTYYQDALFEMMATDNLCRVSNIRVYYRTDVTWNYVTATPAGMSFLATIPAFDWGNEVEYYIQMWDMLGNTNIADNGGSYYSYSIVDNINPTVEILNVNTSSKLGIESVEIGASDYGSDIAYILLYDTGELVGNITAEPYNFVYDSSIKQVDGQRHLIAEAFDNAGNSEVAEMVLGVNLPSGFVSFFQSWGTLIGAAIVGTAWVTVVLIKVFKKPKT